MEVNVYIDYYSRL